MNGFHLDPGWLWLIGGVVLLIAELIAPGFFLIFIGAAAIATGLCSRCCFGLAGRTAARDFSPSSRSLRRALRRPPLLCDRATIIAPIRFSTTGPVGCSARSSWSFKPVDENGGRVRVGDSEWSARGGPAAVGERVRIVDVDGNCLKVEPEHTLPPA